MRSVLVLVCASLAMACDFTPAVEIETPTFEPEVVMRAVLAAGQAPVVRLSVSQDPLLTPVAPQNRRPSVTPGGATVTVLRDGRVIETLAARSQTCYTEARSVCNATTGQTESTQSGGYDCGAFGGQIPVEAGATYTVRASVPGLPVAEATVTVPEAPVISAEDDGSDATTSRLRIRVRDAPGAGTRYALSVYREYDAFTTQVCRVGGPRDTLIAIGGPPFAYQTVFATSDPVLLADVPVPSATLQLAPFTDATFQDGEASVRVALPTDGMNPGARLTGGLLIRVFALSPGLYETYRTAETLLADDNPFAEPAELPGNVSGGFGVVGASARTDAHVPPRRAF